MAGAGSDAVEVDVVIRVVAPAPSVWRALVDPTLRSRWWGHLELDAVAGTRFAERWTDPDGEEKVTSGQVVDVRPPHLLRLTWADDDWLAPTEVLVTLSAPDPEGQGAQTSTAETAVRVRHTGFEGLPEAGRLAEEHSAGWRTHLTNLRDAVQQRT